MAIPRTLSDVESDLTEAQAALSAARRAVSYSQGDRQVNRAPLIALRQDVSRLQREWREMTAAAAGATSPHFVTPSWP